jgi:uncharacterized coiled-coil DUF342 family protein
MKEYVCLGIVGNTRMNDITKDLHLEVELLKKEVKDMKEIHVRLDTAITKITDVSNCIHRMLAVHDEKIANAEEAQAKSTNEFTKDIKELHGRITSTTNELRDLMTQQHRVAESSLNALRDDIQGRVAILDRWRYLIIGGSIVVGFILQKLPIW